MHKAFVLAALTLATSSLFAQARDFSNVQIKATKVAGNVYMPCRCGGSQRPWNDLDLLLR